MGNRVGVLDLHDLQLGYLRGLARGVRRFDNVLILQTFIGIATRFVLNRLMLTGVVAWRGGGSAIGAKYS